MHGIIHTHQKHFQKRQSDNGKLYTSMGGLHYPFGMQKGGDFFPRKLTTGLQTKLDTLEKKQYNLARKERCA